MTADLTKIARLTLKVLKNEDWNFPLTFKNTGGAPFTGTLIGATAQMPVTHVNSGVINQTLSVGAGITVTAFNILTFTPTQIVTIGEYKYRLEITLANGDIIRIYDKIIVINE